MAPLKSPKRQRIHATDAGNATKIRRKRASARNATKRPKRVASSTGDEPLPSLPQELIFEILFRVPVKSLIRFKCVSKSWEALISDPKFAKNHLRTSSNDPNATHHKLLSSIVGHQEVLSFSLHALFRNPKSISDKPHSINMSDKYHILGSCNGLVCVCDIHYRYVMLCNLATKLTSRRFPTSLNPGMCLTFHGFGYDDLNDKYKLLVVEEDLNLTVTKVFTFGENSWKVIRNFRPYCPTEWQGKFLNGSLHWLSKTKVRAGDKDRRLVSFDVRTETYNSMVIVFDGIDQVSNLGLNVLRNNLSFCFFDRKEGCWVIWLMKEYGVGDSCTELLKIPHIDPFGRRKRRLFSSGLDHPLNLVCISDNGVLIFKTEFCQMVLYDPKNRCCTFINHISGDIKFHHLQVYHESLVSPLC